MANLVEPILRTRFTDMSAPLFSYQYDHPCKDFEIRFVTCMEAYGKSLGSKKCVDLKLDLNECVYNDKQMFRVLAMKHERARQYKAGERKAEDYYGPIPKPDSF